MKILLLLALAALSKADVSHLSGYQYQNPASQSSYSAPQGSVVGHGSNSVSTVNFVQYSQQQQPSNAYQFSSQYSQSTGSGLPSISHNGAALNSFNVGAGSSQGFDFGAGASQGTTGFGFGATNGQSSSNGAAFDFGAGSSQGTNGGAAFDFGAGATQGTSGFGAGQSNGAASFNFGNQQSSGISAYQGQTSGGNIDESFGVVTDAAADVSKHLYFFSAPEEEDEVIHAKYDLPAVPAKKTYKIIFIKAPSYKNQGTIVVPAAPQNEEKTLVYVLVKKPEGQPKVHFKEAAPTQPSKPEVFFIKYKTQKEAENAVAEIQSKHGASGQVIANLPAGTQAAFQSPDGSIVHNPSSVDIGSLTGIGSSSGGIGSSSGSFGGSVSGGFGGAASLSAAGYGGSVSGASSSSSGGFSLDSLGANSATIDSRIGGHETSEQAGVNVQVTADQGFVSQSPTPASFGHSSVDSSSGFSVVTSSSESAPQENSEELTTVETPSSAGQDCCSGNVGGSDNEVQGSTSAGFSEYGVPKNRRFATYKNYKV